MPSVASLTVLIQAEDNASAVLDKVGAKVDATAKQAQRGKELIAKGAIGLGAAMQAGFGAAIMGAANFEQGMSGVQAATNATTDQMADLREEALGIGKDTKFSATEATGAIEVLGKAGMSVETILAGGARAVTDIAAAVDADLGSAAETTTGIINSFNLSNAQIPQIADEVTRSINASSMGIGDYNAGMRNLAPTLASFSHSQEEAFANFQDGNIALEIFTNRNLKAADAGLSLTRGITNLAQMTPRATEAMEEYGVSITAFDPAGNFVGLPALFEQVQTATEGMTDAAKTDFLTRVFGAEAIDVMTIAANEGIDAFIKQKEVHDAAAGAAESAAIRMDNLKGALEQLRGSAETALVAMGTPFLGVLKSMAQGLNALVGLFLKLPGPIQAAIGAVAGIGGVLIAAAGAAFLFAPQIAAVSTALKSMGGMGGLLGRIGLPLGRLALGLGVVGIAAGALYLAYRKNWFGIRDITNRVVDRVQNRLAFLRTQFDLARQQGLGPLESALTSVRSVFPSLAGAMDALIPHARGLDEWWARTQRQLTFLTASYHLFRNAGLNPLQAALAALRQEVPQLAGAFEVLDAVTAGVTTAFQKFRDAAGFVGGAIGEIGGALLSGDFGRAWDLFKAKVESVWNALQAIPWGAVSGAILGGLQSASDVLLGWAQSAYDAIATSVGNIDWSGIANQIGVALGEALDLIGQGIEWVLDVGVPKLVGWVTYAGTWLGNQIQTFIRNVAPRLADWVLDVGVPKLVGWVTYAASWVGNQIQSMIGVGGVVPRLIGWVLDVGVPKLVGWITYASSWIGNQIQTFIIGVAPRLANWILDVGVPKLAGWITYAQTWIANQIQTLVRATLPRLDGWTLDIGVPKLAGWITYAQTWLANQIRTLLGVGEHPKLEGWTLVIGTPTGGEYTGDPLDNFIKNEIEKTKADVRGFNNWRLEIAAPLFREFVGDLSPFIKSEIQKTKADVTGFTNWALGIGIPLTRSFQGDLGPFIKSEISKTKADVSDFTNWTLNIGKGTVGSVADMSVSIYNKIPKQTVSDFTKWTLNVGEGVVGSVADMGVAIYNKMPKQTVSDFTKWTLDVGQGVVGSVADMSDAIKDKIGDIVVSISDWTIDLVDMPKINLPGGFDLGKILRDAAMANPVGGAISGVGDLLGPQDASAAGPEGGEGGANTAVSLATAVEEAAARIRIAAADIGTSLSGMATSAAAAGVAFSAGLSMGMVAAAGAVTANLLTITTAVTTAMLAIPLAASVAGVAFSANLSLGMFAAAGAVTANLAVITTAVTTAMTAVALAGTTAGVAFSAGLSMGFFAAAGAVTALTSQITAETQAMAAAVGEAGSSGGIAFSAGISTGYFAAAGAVTALTSQITAETQAMAAAVGAAGQQAGAEFAAGISSGMSAAVGAAQSGAAAIVGAMQSAAGAAFGAGVAVGSGFASGISSQIGAVQAAGAALAAAASAAIASVARIFSPSKVTRDMGKEVGRGFAFGMGDTGALVSKTAGQLARDTVAMLGAVAPQPAFAPAFAAPARAAYGGGYATSAYGGGGTTTTHAPTYNIYASVDNIDDLRALIRDLEDERDRSLARR